jgi:hypothetical protein
MWKEVLWWSVGERREDLEEVINSKRCMFKSFPIQHTCTCSRVVVVSGWPDSVPPSVRTTAYHTRYFSTAICVIHVVLYELIAFLTAPMELRLSGHIPLVRTSGASRRGGGGDE